MSKLQNFRKYFMALTMVVAVVAADSWLGTGYIARNALVTDAQARFGRPRTPVSIAGAARRTTRRVVRRSTIYVTSLPAACGQATVSGVVVWRCGSTYYQPYGGRYVVVYLD